MARTVASGADSDGQINAIAIIRAVFAGLSRVSGTPPATMVLTGPAVFAAEARRTIQQRLVGYRY